MPSLGLVVGILIIPLTSCRYSTNLMVMANAKEPQIGMHPMLEEPRFFPDLHASLCVDIRYWIAPRLPERYTISVERGLSMTGPSGKSKQYRPDARIDRVESPDPPYSDTVIAQPPSFMVDIPSQPQRYLAIRDDDDELITTIEILSPVNKTGDGYEDFRRKQEQLTAQQVHLVEIDLLTRGKGRWRDERVDAADYIVSVQRVTSTVASIWATARGEALPTIPIPLRKPDADIPLPLEQILQEYLSKSGIGRRFN